jgi:hypothetical protein
MNSPFETSQTKSPPAATDVLLDEIEKLWCLQIGILDEIDDQIEAAEDMGAEMHMLETRAEKLRDEIGSTFSRLRNAGNNDVAWERAFLQAGALYEDLVSFREIVTSEVMLIAGAAEIRDAASTQAFLH